ncbi:DinB family protein [Cytobacillus sp. FJAT-54145]|uniref:DinB family protein n=1 Tax=Cytobacillus spartinae TaxID=3299023 RepID=A0ABW6K7F2_9BACI
MIDYRITSKEGYDDKIGDLVTMLEYTRATILEDIEDLTPEDLDFLPDESSNSIGALLLHIAAIEFVHQVFSFENRDLNNEELLKWDTALSLGAKARAEIKNKPLEYYTKILTEIRERTLTLFKTQQDSWLYEEKPWGKMNNYWYWFHVMEDELNHRGQIRVIKRLLENHQ